MNEKHIFATDENQTFERLGITSLLEFASVPARGQI